MATPQEISKIFVALFNRVTDSNTSEQWQKKDEYGVALINAILETPEASSFKGLHTQRFVELIYTNALGKSYADDPEGIKWWVNAMDSNQWSKAELLVRFLDTIDRYRSGEISSNEAEKNAVTLFDTKMALGIYAKDTIKQEVNDLKSLTFGQGLTEIKASNITTAINTVQSEIQKIGGVNNGNDNNEPPKDDSSQKQAMPNEPIQAPNEELAGVHPGTDFGTIA